MSEAELEIEMSSVVELESNEVLSASELVEVFKVSSVPPLHEMIVRLTKKMIKMTKIFFTFSSKYLFVGKNLIQEIIFFTENINIFSLISQIICQRSLGIGLKRKLINEKKDFSAL